MAMLCCRACRSQPTIFISASFVPSLLVGYRKVYSVRCEADLVMTSVIHPLDWNQLSGVGVYIARHAQHNAADEGVHECCRVGVGYCDSTGFAVSTYRAAQPSRSEATLTYRATLPLIDLMRGA